MSKRSKNQAKKQRDRTKNKRQRLLKVRASPQDSSPSSEVGKDDSAPPTEVGIAELEAIIACSEKGPLSEQDRQLLLSAAQTLRFLTAQLEKKSISIAALKKLLFGVSTETSKNPGLDTSDQDEADSQEDQDNDDQPSESKQKRPGHGRNGVEAYTGAKKVQVPHETFKPGDPCPECLKGKLYETSKPGTIVCVTGRAPLEATGL